MVQKKTGMQQDFLSEEDRQEAYIAHQLKKAKTEEFLPSQNPTDPGLGLFPRTSQSHKMSREWNWASTTLRMTLRP